MRAEKNFWLIKKGDRAMLLICAVLAFFAVIFFVSRGFISLPREMFVSVAINGKVIDTMHVDNGSGPFERTYKTESGFNTVRVESGGAAIISADCRDLLCVRHGRLTRRGDSSICLPNRFTVRIMGTDKTNGIDGGTW